MLNIGVKRLFGRNMMVGLVVCRVKKRLYKNRTENDTFLRFSCKLKKQHTGMSAFFLYDKFSHILKKEIEHTRRNLLAVVIEFMTFITLPNGGSVPLIGEVRFFRRAVRTSRKCWITDVINLYNTAH